MRSKEPWLYFQILLLDLFVKPSLLYLNDFLIFQVHLSEHLLCCLQRKLLDYFPIYMLSFMQSPSANNRIDRTLNVPVMRDVERRVYAPLNGELLRQRLVGGARKMRTAQQSAGASRCLAVWLRQPATGACSAQLAVRSAYET